MIEKENGSNMLLVHDSDWVCFWGLLMMSVSLKVIPTLVSSVSQEKPNNKCRAQKNAASGKPQGLERTDDAHASSTRPRVARRSSFISSSLFL